MPVRLTAVQTHNRQQAEGETVEQFAQELQKLFNQAYARAAQEAEEHYLQMNLSLGFVLS